MIWLYRILILPIEYLIEVVFTVMNSFFGHEGFAIIAVSIAISTLVLPLYLRADAVQEEEQNKQKKMERWLNHIKATFHGDERYMMTNAYYAEMQYKPLYALRGLIPLFLQIPFFIAAFHFLSNMQRLQGCSFGWIADLGAEDGMLHLGGYSLNLLPILMTFFNVCSTVIYTRGFSWKQKLQPYLLALFFLIVLYHSPSGLVLYWTMNNLYSFLKNAIQKTAKKPAVVVGTISIAGAVGIILFLLKSGKLLDRIRAKDPEAVVLYAALVMIVLLPFLVQVLRWIGSKTGAAARKQKAEAAAISGFVVFAEEMSFTVLLGMVI
ncbi:MAG: membrane protein insertase YidC, partial [Parasporobacterium sp.]|nr:membrane protein insertase YidC [Parasporobacterium sp.]